MKLYHIAFLIYIFGAFSFIYMHEQVHVEIYRNYGIESHVEYFSHFPAAVTIAEEGCYVEECNLAHNINEAVGYHLQVVFGVIGAFLIIILIAIEEH